MIRVFKVFIPRVVIALLLGDIVLSYACFLLSAAILQGDMVSFFLFEEDGFRNITIVVATIILSLYFQSGYSDFRRVNKAELLQQQLMAVGATLIVQALGAYVNRNLMLSRTLILIAATQVLLLLPLWRLLCVSRLRETLGVRRILFLGADESGVDLASRLIRRPELGMGCVGFVDNRHEKGSLLAGMPVLGPISELRSIVAESRADEIVVNLAERRNAMPVDVLLDLRFAGIRIVEPPTLHEEAFGRVPARSLRPSQLIFASELGPQPWILQLQTIYSFLIALVGLVLSSPIMILVALAVKLTSPGPALFRQKRVGLNGKSFEILKFRSMGVDAEASTGAVWATRNDPRVTSIGAFLRKTRLDELPQIFNVLRGDMSVVGPRPERPEFVSVLSEQIPFYRQRHVVKPGVTGWAQINYKYGDTIEDTIVKLEYDLYYIKNLAPSLDLYIILDTLKVMLFSDHGQ